MSELFEMPYDESAVRKALDKMSARLQPTFKAIQCPKCGIRPMKVDLTFHIDKLRKPHVFARVHGCGDRELANAIQACIDESLRLGPHELSFTGL